MGAWKKIYFLNKIWNIFQMQAWLSVCFVCVVWTCLFL
jgi:hypothetical protein